MIILWISAIALIVTILTLYGVAYGEDGQPSQPGFLVISGNSLRNGAESPDEI